MSDRVKVTREGSIAIATLDRPEKRNALDLAMFEALVETGLGLARDRTVRAVVLRGEGKAFSAGLDFAAFAALGQGGATLLLTRGTDSPANLAQRAGWIWRELPVPVIAAVHGVAFGGGLLIALGADLRYVTPDAQLSVMEIKWGLIPDMSGSRTLLELLPLDVAKELTFTGRIVSGEEAVKIGLATRVEADPLAAALVTARQIAARNPHAIRAGKRLFDEAGDLGVEAGLRLESELQVPLLGSANQMEAVLANMQKRDPSFRDPE
jgi:enoyl-CoA hydratase/carnithine racemase